MRTAAFQAPVRMVDGHFAQEGHHRRLVGGDKGTKIAGDILPFAGLGVFDTQRCSVARQQPDRFGFMQFHIAIQIFHQDVERGACQFIDLTQIPREEGGRQIQFVTFFGLSSKLSTAGAE